MKAVLAFLAARLAEPTTKAAFAGVVGAALAALVGQITPDAALTAAIVALLPALTPDRARPVLAEVAEATAKALKPAFAIFLLGTALALSACQGAPTPDGAAKSFAGQVAAFDADAQGKVKAFAEGALTDAKVVGQSACGYLSMANGLFKLVTPVLLLSGTAGPEIPATEAAVFAGVQLGCAILDKADPSTPADTVATAAAQVLAAIPQVKAALKAADPAVAAAATAPSS